MTDAVRTLQSIEGSNTTSDSTQLFNVKVGEILKTYEEKGIVFDPNDVKYLTQFAKEMHERWKEGLNGADAIRATTDTQWLAMYEGKKVKGAYYVGTLKNGNKGAIISNCSFEELPLDWKLENIQDLIEAFRIVQDFYKTGRSITNKNISEISRQLHEAWVERTILRSPERESEIEKDYDQLNKLYIHRNNAYRLEMARDMILRLRLLNGGVEEIKSKKTLRESMEIEIKNRSGFPKPVGYPEQWGNPNLSKMSFSDEEIKEWEASGMKGDVLIEMILRKSGKTLEEIKELRNDTGAGFSIYPPHDNIIKKGTEVLPPEKWKIRKSSEYKKGLYPSKIVESLKSGVNIPLTIDPRNGELTFYQGFYWDPGLNYAGDAVFGGAMIREGRLAFCLLTIEPVMFPGSLAIPGGMVEAGDIKIKKSVVDSVQLREVMEETQVRIHPDCRVPGTESQSEVEEGRATLTNAPISEAFFYLIPMATPFEYNAKAGDDSTDAQLQIANSELFSKFHSPTHIKFVMNGIRIFEQQNPGLVVGEDGFIYLAEGVEVNKIDGELMLKSGYQFDSINGKVVSIETEEYTKNLKIVAEESEAYAQFRNIIGEDKRFNKNVFELFNSEYTPNLKVWGQTTITGLSADQLSRIKVWAEQGLGKGKFLVKIVGKDVVIERAFYKSTPKALVRLYVPEKAEDRRALIRDELSKLMESDQTREMFEDLKGVISVIGGASLISPEQVQSIDRRLQDIIMIIQQKVNGKFGIVDGGTDTGVMKAVGSAERRLNGMLTSIGISPLGGMTNWFAPLNTLHDLSIVLNNYNDFGEETDFMMMFISELKRIFEIETTFTVLANGGKITVVEAFKNIREGRKVLLLGNSGRTCDILEAILEGRNAKIGVAGRETLSGDDTKNLNEIINQMNQTYTEQGFGQEIANCIVTKDGNKVLEFDVSRSPVILERIRQDFVVAKGETLSELEKDVDNILARV